MTFMKAKCHPKVIKDEIGNHAIGDKLVLIGQMLTEAKKYC